MGGFSLSDEGELDRGLWRFTSVRRMQMTMRKEMISNLGSLQTGGPQTEGRLLGVPR